MDAATISLNTDSVKVDQSILTNGSHTLSVTIIDTTSFLKVDNHSTIHVSTVNWTINKTTTRVELTDNNNQIFCSIFPNPANDILNFSILADKRTDLEIKIVSIDGKIIKQTNKEKIEGEYTNSLNIESLVKGTYFILFKLGDNTITETLIKE